MSYMKDYTFQADPLASNCTPQRGYFDNDEAALEHARALMDEWNTHVFVIELRAVGVVDVPAETKAAAVATIVSLTAAVNWATATAKAAGPPYQPLHGLAIAILAFANRNGDTKPSQADAGDVEGNPA